MKVSVNESRCIKAGECYSAHADLFAVRKDGFAEAKLRDVPAGREEAARDAARVCPGNAIVIEE